MSIIGSNILAGAAGQGGGYTIENSLRLRSSASAYLSRTPASAGNRQTFTYSVWVKRGSISSRMSILDAYASSAGHVLEFQSDNTLDFYSWGGGATILEVKTTQVFRDLSAWYHIVFAVDTTQATASNRVKLYVNDSLVTAFDVASYPSQNASLYIDNNIVHDIGRRGDAQFYFDGYLTEVNFIDGQALTPSDFGDYNEDTGVWQPAAYAGTYGTNGFYLPFSDATNTTTLAADASGNGNDWTPNNISLTSGATYDSMTDTPTPYAGGGNYAVLNPLDNGGVTLSNANLTITGSGNAFKIVRNTFGMSSGKWYCEFVITTQSAPSRIDFGLLGYPATLSGFLGDTANGYAVFESGGNIAKYNNSTGATLVAGNSLDPSDVQMLAYDADAGKLWFGKNGSWFASGDPTAGTSPVFSSVSGQTYFVAVQAYNSSDVGKVNFGQRPFAYTPPTGFLPLHTGNLPDSAIVDGSEYFDVSTWTGTGGNRTISGLTFQPDLVWVKSRSSAYWHNLYDSIRGVGSTKNLSSNTTNAEGNSADLYGYVSALTSDGFSMTNGTDASFDDIWTNDVGATYVAWNWKANGAGVSNTDGSITSTVSANPTAGFSVVTYIANNVAGATVGHGLNTAPQLIIQKDRDSTEAWLTYHKSLGATKYLLLNSTIAAPTSASAWNNTEPTSSVYSLGAGYISTNDHVAYCFAEVEGYSKFGSYTGNGSTDGPFVFTGFRPKFVMVKRTDSSGSWQIKDTARNTSNLADLTLFANLSNAEYTAFYFYDLLSNGFKVRGSDAELNASGGNYIYMAFAENPFKNSLAR